MNNPGPLDFLKLVAADANTTVRCAIDQLIQLGNENEALQSPRLIEAIDMLNQHRGRLLEHAVRFCADSDALDHYSDGRRVESYIELEPGQTFAYRWHPALDHPDNEPRTLVDRHVCRDGRVVKVVVTAPGVLDVIELDPGT